MSHEGDQAIASIPDFRNLGVVFRAVVISELASLSALAAYSPEGLLASLQMPPSGPLFEISLLLVLMTLFVSAPAISRLRYRPATLLVLLIAATVSGAVEVVLGWWLEDRSLARVIRSALLAALLTGMILVYFDWRQRILSPALAEARLLALQARIRPHFLFNSINTAASLIREDPRLAERVLLDLCDLFRAALSERRLLVPFRDEISLARAYIEVEQLRLGERLQVRWDCEDVSEDAFVPFLLLQPLLENAIHHGIERCSEQGVVTVRVHERAGFLIMEIRNTLPPLDAGVPRGNRIAVDNIRERLALLFDAEAQFLTEAEQGVFVVRIGFPTARSRNAYAASV
ncbi:MAG TPA: histidine kinase [Aromatoleum sp.]|uniref:sensor histidine kinase n=1 Tax=Aromatoleum sp. TaxID=2307007 RepID=UPI002B4658D5|nr:histidine kinase [Aromatoleum sp.]HJV25670.1 histidine kinase [Aromatoleum sp.]